jgi:murein DD-endopeptidase MepM/ murein hydrolase activator NlpD
MESSKTISQEAIDEYKSQYEEMVLAYVDNNLSEIPTISRGDRKPASFKEDVAELRALIDVVETAKLSEENVSAAISDKADELNEYLDALPTLWPTRGTTIDSPFGRRLHPIYKKYLTHEGIDIGYNKDPVYAAGTGKVILAGWNGGYGNCIVINHGNGYKTVYGHLRQIKVKEGQWVTKGEEIGIIGNTGNSTGPHLHFEVRVNDVAIDPTYFVDP